jgi:hypothetical protein
VAQRDFLSPTAFSVDLPSEETLVSALATISKHSVKGTTRDDE